MGQRPTAQLYLSLLSRLDCRYPYAHGELVVERHLLERERVRPGCVDLGGPDAAPCVQRLTPAGSRCQDSQAPEPEFEDGSVYRPRWWARGDCTANFSLGGPDIRKESVKIFSLGNLRLTNRKSETQSYCSGCGPYLFSPLSPGVAKNTNRMIANTPAMMPNNKPSPKSATPITKNSPDSSARP